MQHNKANANGVKDNFDPVHICPIHIQQQNSIRIIITLSKCINLLCLLVYIYIIRLKFYFINRFSRISS